MRLTAYPAPLLRGLRADFATIAVNVPNILSRLFTVAHAGHREALKALFSLAR
jgi:hypothetical protein